MSYSDFNNDGFDDLAIGVRGETIGTAVRAGAVNVFLGTGSGLSSAGNQWWTQDSDGIDSAPESFDFFGGAVGSGDFDGDGYDDLAVGARGESVGDVDRAGSVNIIYGSAAGLTAAGTQIWHQDSAGILDKSEYFDFFGGGMTIGDFNGDGYDDLAVGSSDEDVDSAVNAGAVNVILGSASGLTSVGNSVWDQNSPGIAGGAEKDDRFARSLATGDFNNDGYDDLVLGVTGEDVGNIKDAGQVNVIRGSAAGLTGTGSQVWHQNTSGVRGTAEAGDSFGVSLAVGDFDGDGYEDLAVGAHTEDIGKVANAGAVSVLRGSASGLTATGDQTWHQNRAGVANDAEADDNFGEVLAAGDFNSDGYDDLAVGVPGEDIGSIKDAGAVAVLYGSASGLRATGDQLWHQDSAGVANDAEAEDHFGTALTVGDFDNDGYDDLAIGVREGVGTEKNAGAVHILFGSASGLTASGDQFWHQDTAGILGAAETNDLFGIALA